jgi:hypothetical protein
MQLACEVIPTQCGKILLYRGVQVWCDGYVDGFTHGRRPALRAQSVVLPANRGGELKAPDWRVMLRWGAIHLRRWVGPCWN